MVIEKNIDDFFDEFLDKKSAENMFDTIQSVIKNAFTEGFVAGANSNQTEKPTSANEDCAL